MLGLLVNPAQYWMFSFDIKSGYHHIDIHASDQQLLGFALVFDSNLRYFVFTVLPFGLYTGPYIFTKVIRPLVKHWRSKAIRIVVYLDDGLGASSTFDAETKQSLSVRAYLVASGFVPNCDKCQWSPTQQLTWLGLDWDLLNQVLKIPARRVTRLLTEIEALADHTKCKTTITARKLASVAGLIMSNSLVFGNICKLMTKAMYRKIESRQLWHSKLILDNHVQQELDFWRKEVNRLNFRFISADLPSPSRFVYSDASSTGCAAYIALDESPIFQKIWTDLEMKQSSAWQELQCINLALLKAFLSLAA